MDKMPMDPLTYVGKVKRDNEGKVREIAVIYGQESVKIKDGDEFITFTTVIDIEQSR